MSIQASPEDVHNRLGHLTRQLHDALNELGLTHKLQDAAKELQGAAKELPDARSRLSYISRLTGDAAEKVLTCVEESKKLNDATAQEAERLMQLFKENPAALLTGGHLYNFLADTKKSAEGVDKNLIDIMMAQDFHDLTGQVIATVVKLATNIEEQLVQILLQTAPEVTSVEPAKETVKEHVPEGPAINPQGNPDVVTSQSQVDDLLASLGF